MNREPFYLCIGMMNRNMKVYKYVGQWRRDGKKHGEGTYTSFKSKEYESYDEELYGDEYVGQWKDDQMHGQGTMYTSNGTIYQQGTFENGQYIGKSGEEPVKASKNKLGKLIGTIGGFEGADIVVNGKDTIGSLAPVGQALIVDANGEYIYLQSTFPM